MTTENGRYRIQHNTRHTFISLTADKKDSRLTLATAKSKKRLDI